MTKRCVTPFDFDGRVVTAGQLLEDGDPVIKGHEAFFADAAAGPQAAVIPGTDKVGDLAQAEPEPDDDEVDDKRGVQSAKPAARTFVVEEATADPGAKRNTGRKP